MQRYFIDGTLLNSHLICLDKFYVHPRPLQLEKNQNITVKLYTGKELKVFDNCHIDDTDDRRLRVPAALVSWIKQHFGFSVAYFESQEERAKGIWKKEDRKRFDEAFGEKNIKMDIPGETIILSWINDQTGTYLLIQEGFRITCENATKYLSEKALASVLPYILSSAENTSRADMMEDGKKCYLIEETTNWLSVEQYRKTKFSHPGIYILRRRDENSEFVYYIGKADDIKKRVIRNDKNLSHPDEKDEDNRQYDEVACISINFNKFIDMFGELNDSNRAPKNNPGVRRGSDVDNALYGVEDIAIHVAAMILLGEGKRLDNKQYRNYTSDWIDGV